MAKEALALAKQRAASMALEDITWRIKGELKSAGGIDRIILPYLDKTLLTTQDGITDSLGNELTKNEQTFVYIHMEQGGASIPTANMKSLKKFKYRLQNCFHVKSRGNAS